MKIGFVENVTYVPYNKLSCTAIEVFDKLVNEDVYPVSKFEQAIRDASMPNLKTL